MLIRCWGARGSIAVSGPEFVRYGGSTTCIELRTAANDVVIIDAGSGIQPLGRALVKEGATQATLLFTHAHWDHLLGLPFFRPLYLHDFALTVHGCFDGDRTLENIISGMMTPPYFPVGLEQFQADIAWKSACSVERSQSLHSFTIETIPLSHPNGGLGYKIVENGKSFVFLTDNEPVFDHENGVSRDDFVEFCRGADVLFHDAEFTEEEYVQTRGWGHSTWIDALELALDANVKQFGLFHHNQDRTDDEVDSIVEECQRIADGRGANISCFGVSQGMEITLP